MKIKEIKAELEERGVEWRDLLEKDEFSLRLAEARVRGTTKSPPPVEDEKKKEENESVDTAEQPRAESSSSSASSPPPPPKEQPAAGGAAASATTKMDEAARYTKALAEVMKLKVRTQEKRQKNAHD